MTGLPARCKLSIKPRWPRQGCIKLSILSPRGTSGERTEERGNQQKRTSSPQPSPPSDGGEGEIEELDATPPEALLPFQLCYACGPRVGRQRLNFFQDSLRKTGRQSLQFSARRTGEGDRVITHSPST